MRNIQFLFLLLLSGLLINCSCVGDKTSKNLDLRKESSAEKVTLRITGMDSMKLAEIPIQMQHFVNEKKIAGAVTLVTHDGEITSFEAVGFQDIEKNIKMHRNTIFLNRHDVVINRKIRFKTFFTKRSGQGLHFRLKAILS